MHMTESSAVRLSALSSEVAGLVSRCGPSVVAIRVRGAHSLSGITWRPGYVVTAAETLDDQPSTLRVISGTGTEHTAKLIGQDPSTDVALLAVDGLSTSGPQLADPTTLRAGEFVLALGRSPEHGPIVTFGTVAVAGASWDSQLGGRIDRFIRVGAAMTPAAQGGAVFDLSGQLLGMAVFGPRRALLAIPVPTIARIAEQLVAKGRISRGYLGLAMQPVHLPEALQRAAGTRIGMLVSNVDPDSSAAVGGILLGDVIVAWNNEPVRDYRQVQQLLGPESIGSSVALVAVRAGALTTLRLTVGERPHSG